jgi:hypothetical protein
MIKSRRMRLAGHEGHVERRGISTGFSWESQKERDHYEDLDVGGRMLLKCILER